MNIEGSRHERVAIVIASYVIGFITALIFFSSTNDVEPVETFINLPNTNPAAVVMTEPEIVEEAVAENETAPKDLLSYVEGRLEVNRPDGALLLSFNPTVSDLELNNAVEKQGFHYGEIIYRLSQSQNFVFFCEQHDPTDATCQGYVYDIKADRINSVVKNGVPVQISAASAASTSWENDTLSIGTNYSANPSVPWILISDDSKLDLQ